MRDFSIYKGADLGVRTQLKEDLRGGPVSLPRFAKYWRYVYADVLAVAQEFIKKKYVVVSTQDRETVLTLTPYGKRQMKGEA